MTNRTQLGGKPFQVIGFDVLIDENLKPWILEINCNPSMCIYYSNEAGFGNRHYESDINQTDLYVNSRVIQDTILMAKKPRNKFESIDTFKSLSKIHPLPDDPAPVYTSLVILRNVFYSLAAIKNKAVVTQQ